LRPDLLNAGSGFCAEIPEAESRILWYTDPSNPNLVRGLDTDADLASANVDDRDLDTRLDENPFAYFATENEHWVPP
jgi:hypothetical protein